ncbi:hypothetical protein BJ166DRAFT_620034 [Pestalotiopsis sp. NC0098]|nr:hypothetical protein BJ166DRAFT_620034 [Pestalotiopsis sp. NC0098]
MRFSALIIPTALSFASGSYAWTQDANGVWVANNNIYNIRGIQVHEACTRMNTETILNSGACAYWTDGAGHQFHGQCKERPGQVLCI